MNKYDSRQDTDPRFRKREPQNDSVFVAIYTPVANTVQITGYGGYSKKLTMAAGTFETVYLNGNPRASAPIVTESGSVVGKTFRLEAESPVVIYCFMVTKFATEAWTPEPVESWGTEYYAAALPGEVLYDEIPGGENNYGKTPKAGPSEIMVIAAFDNTRVTIVPNARLDKNPPVSVLLMKDQCYQVQSYVDTNSFNLGNPQPDLGGSYIYSTKPIGVISGNTRSQVLDNSGGLAKNSFKNMMIEWMTPTDQHGTKFVYLPTWDDWRPTGAPGEDPSTKRQGEVVRVYATSGSANDDPPTVTSVADVDGLNGQLLKTTNVDRSKFYETLIGAANPHYFTTDHPAEAFMNTTAVVQFDGTTGGGNFVGSTYEGVATYMVELTPREQWTYNAPFIAPIHPPKMQHYMNIVTDSASRNKITINGIQVLINRPIAGTDLYWGSRILNRGDQGVIQGADTSAKFYAFVYGGMKSIETYRPGKTRKEGDGSETGGATDRRSGKSSNQVLHPSEYEENIGLMYGYPVAPSRLVLRPSDSLLIDTTYDCGVLTVKVRTINDKPVGLRTISLDSAVNAKLTFVDPAPPEPVIGLTKSEVNVRPIDPRKDASGVVVIQDRTGKTWRVPYHYEAEYVNMVPSDILDFGQVTKGSTQRKTVTIVNPLSKPISVDTLMLMLGTQSFKIVDTKPPLSHDPNNRTMIGPGDSIVVTIEINPTIQNKLYEDTLRVKFGCTEAKLPLRGETVQPCLNVPDLDFGTLAPGQEASLPLKLCNQGRGEIHFLDPFLKWVKTEFNVSQADIDLLKNTVLGPNDCVTITVTFKSNVIGSFDDIGQFFVSAGGAADGCRDASKWTALVTKPGPYISGHDWDKQWLTTGNPCTKNTIGEYTWDVYAINTGTKDFTVAKVVLDGPDADAGIFLLDPNAPPEARITPGDLIKAGDTNTYRRFQRVLFRPVAEQDYSCTIWLISDAGDSVPNRLHGIGIESHVGITDWNFGKPEFIAPGNPTVPGSVDLTSTPSTRPMTVTGLQLTNTTDFAFTTTPPTITDGAGNPVTIPFTMQPNETYKVAVQFNPQTPTPTKKTGQIIVLGDFARCPDAVADSVGDLTGEVYTTGAVSTGDTRPAILACDMDTAYVTLSNTGDADLNLIGASLENGYGGQLQLLLPPVLPVTITGQGTPGGTIKIPVVFTPSGEGAFNDKVDFIVQKGDGTNAPVTVDPAPVSFTSYTIKGITTVGRDYSAFPGSTLTIPFTFDAEPATDLERTEIQNAQVTSLTISFTYDKGMMLLDNGSNNGGSLTNGTLLQGWTMTPVTSKPGIFEAKFDAPAGDYLRGPFPGTLLNPRFRTFLGSVSTTDIKPWVTPNYSTKCAVFDTTIGFARIDSVCGLNFRLIEMLGSKYSLGKNRPNPFNPSTDIEFSVGLDGQTSLVIYNAIGERVATLVDQYLQPGTYKVTWDATAFPSGLYYYRLNSGDWSQTNTMILSK